ncbi:MAG: DUF1877 family protein [Proteobacteria bacterium]|nr:MAG: DUF1877 family protein [Pseudomonadota bacterium]
MMGNLLRVTEHELEGYLTDSSLLEDVVFAEVKGGNSKLVEIDKAWDGIVYLLTGQGIAKANHPLLRVLFSGQFIDEEQDLGYGPAHYLTPEQVATLNTEISKITVEYLRKSYDPKKMMELQIYPLIWEQEGDEAFTYLAENFNNLQRVYSDAATNGEAIITFLT